MWFKNSSAKPYISEEARAIARNDDDRKRFYDMRDSSSEEFEVKGRKVRISTGNDNLKVVQIRR